MSLLGRDPKLKIDPALLNGPLSGQASTGTTSTSGVSSASSTANGGDLDPAAVAARTMAQSAVDPDFCTSTPTAPGEAGSQGGRLATLLNGIPPEILGAGAVLGAGAAAAGIGFDLIDPHFVLDKGVNTALPKAANLALDQVGPLAQEGEEGFGLRFGESKPIGPEHGYQTKLGLNPELYYQWLTANGNQMRLSGSGNFRLLTRPEDGLGETLPDPGFNYSVGLGISGSLGGGGRERKSQTQK